MQIRDIHQGRRFSPEKLQKVGLFATPQLFFDLYCLEPGQSQKTHRHDGASKIYLVLEGRATVQVGEDSEVLVPGQAALAPAGELHGVRNPTDERLVLLVTMAPPPDQASK